MYFKSLKLAVQDQDISDSLYSYLHAHELQIHGCLNGLHMQGKITRESFHICSSTAQKQHGGKQTYLFRVPCDILRNTKRHEKKKDIENHNHTFTRTWACNSVKKIEAKDGYFLKRNKLSSNKASYRSTKYCTQHHDKIGPQGRDKPFAVFLKRH